MPAIDMSTWSRRAVHDFFLDYEDPWFNISAEVEVGPTRRWCRAHRAPFSLACWYAVVQAANAVPAFRMRLRPGGVWLHERVRVGATSLKPDGALTFVYYPDAADFPTFAHVAKTMIAERMTAAELEPQDSADDLLHCTMLPWVRFTSIKHARAIIRGGSVPRIAIGKATAVGTEVFMPVSVEGHHSLIDGVHVGAFLDGLQAALAAPEATFQDR